MAKSVSLLSIAYCVPLVLGVSKASPQYLDELVCVFLDLLQKGRESPVL